jgi:hypothetical protein
MDQELVTVAARLVGCKPEEVLVVGWREDGSLGVVWGIGYKKVFSRGEADCVRPLRAQMIIEPTEDVEGLHRLFSRRLVVALLRAGFSSPGAVQLASDEELLAVGGIGPTTLRDIRELLPVLGQREYAGGYVDTL